MATEVTIHVGAPKTGTTYLQSRLSAGRNLLRERGILFPGRGINHHGAARALRAVHGPPARSPGSPQRLRSVISECQAWPGRVLISSELLCFGPRTMFDELAASLAPAKITVIYTARDLGRILPSDWQEHVRRGKAATFDSWLADVSSDPATSQAARWFWHSHDIPAVARRWDPGEAGSFRLVTHPSEGGGEQFWLRFCEAAGINPEGMPDTVRLNESLDATQLELLRQLNAKLTLDRAEYDARINDGFTRKILVPNSTGPRLALPASYHAWVDGQARRISAELEKLMTPNQAALRVYGSLDDLRFRPPDRIEPGPKDSQVGEAAVTSLAEVLGRPSPPAKGPGAGPEHGSTRSPRVGHRLLRRTSHGLRRFAR